jgi:protein-S-isoprenylcysteine O-methyltransferase Ste14
MLSLADFAPTLAFIVIASSTALRWLVVARRIGRQPVLVFQGDHRQRAVGFLFVVALVALFAAALSIVIRPRELAPGLRGLGGMLALAGTALLAIAQVQMGQAWRVGVAEGDAPHLVATGLFRFSRNPIYVGMMLIGFGTALAAGRGWGWLAFVVEVAAVRATVAIEERHLTESLGAAYLDCCDRVRRWL